jgi:hypothetical protein
MSALSLLAGTIVSIVEKELESSGPVLADIIVQEIELLIAKLESLVAGKTKPQG